MWRSFENIEVRRLHEEQFTLTAPQVVQLICADKTAIDTTHRGLGIWRYYGALWTIYIRGGVANFLGRTISHISSCQRADIKRRGLAAIEYWIIDAKVVGKNIFIYFFRMLIKSDGHIQQIQIGPVSNNELMTSCISTLFRRIGGVFSQGRLSSGGVQQAERNENIGGGNDQYAPISDRRALIPFLCGLLLFGSGCLLNYLNWNWLDDDRYRWRGRIGFILTLAMMIAGLVLMFFVAGSVTGS